MEGRGPYRIYDPGGSVPSGEASAAFERLVKENSRLKEKMQGIKMLACFLRRASMEFVPLGPQSNDGSEVQGLEPRKPWVPKPSSGFRGLGRGKVVLGAE
ncbi:TNFAIP3-interacting protein 1 [Saguinus oedipus]|uniref:TNFAIP3-interacting protein 1 n=1 Tax=Saguinus oedipus TaxID=9490 RepID=A0ABQ9W4Q7_SAGOE|nr:TNFAIP3-interacting protein 1 [Saguinus oedipus]